MMKPGMLVRSAANVGEGKNKLGLVLSAVIDEEVVVMWVVPGRPEPHFKSYTWRAANGWLLEVQR